MSNKLPHLVPKSHTHTHPSATRYPMQNRDVINISLRVIKSCGMYSKEYKNWIAGEHVSPPIDKTIDSFK